jgi:F0F1-type ATP synthase gamma subunit
MPRAFAAVFFSTVEEELIGGSLWAAANAARQTTMVKVSENLQRMVTSFSGQNIRGKE